MWATIEAAIAAFKKIDGIQSVDVGIEDDISPADFPLIRIEPEKYDPGRPYTHRTGTFNVVFGVPIAASENRTSDASGLRTVYEQLHTLEAAIINTIRADLDGRYLTTVFFDRRVRVPFKLLAVRCELKGVIPAPAA